MMERNADDLAKIVPIGGIYNLERAEIMRRVVEELGLTRLRIVKPGRRYSLLRGRWKGDIEKSVVPEGCVFIQIRMPRGKVGGFWTRVREIKPLPPSDSDDSESGLVGSFLGRIRP